MFIVFLLAIAISSCSFVNSHESTAFQNPDPRILIKLKQAGPAHEFPTPIYELTRRHLMIEIKPKKKDGVNFKQGWLPNPDVKQATPATYNICNGGNQSLAVGQSLIVTAPNYPDDYPQSTWCPASFYSPAGTIMHLKCSVFNVNCPDGFFSSSTSFSAAQKACGDFSPGFFDITTTRNSLFLIFMSGMQYSNPYGDAQTFSCLISVK